MNDHRYGIKFILDEAKLSQAKSWLFKFTSARSTYPSRVVNSVYFYDQNYSSLRENLTGISEWRKIRLRWYHDQDKEKTNGANLEVKHRKERLGYQDWYALPGFEKFILKTQYRDLFSGLHAHLGRDDVFLMDVVSSLRHLNLTPKRHSKYLTGLAAFGTAVYF